MCIDYYAIVEYILVNAKNIWVLHEKRLPHVLSDIIHSDKL